MVRLESVSKHYRTRRGAVKALDRATLHIDPGEFVAIKGPSGSGKTTLLMMLGGMLAPTDGKVVVNDRDLYALSPRERSAFRARHVGFVFQMFHLVPFLTVKDNVALAARSAEVQNNAETLLNNLGLGQRTTHHPAELSAGERQRAAIARALLNQPRLVLADEPTGNLDEENTHEVLALLSEYQKNGGTVVMVTHGSDAAPYVGRTIRLRDGRIEDAT